MKKGFSWISVVLVFFILLICARNYRIAIDEYAIIDPALSIILRGDCDVDEYSELHPISFTRDGHFYAWATPFFGLIFAPFYLIGRQIPFITGISRVFEIIPSILSVIGSMLIIYKILKMRGVKENIAMFSSWNFAFGTIILFYSVTILRHVVASFLTLLIYFALYRKASRWELFGAGLLTGYLVMINEVFLALLAFFLVFSPLILRSRRRWLTYAAGTIPGVIGLLMYNYLIIGSPFVTTRMLEPLTAGWFTYPSLLRAISQLYLPRMGLFVFTPLFTLPILIPLLNMFKKRKSSFAGAPLTSRPIKVFMRILSRPTPKKIYLFLTFWAGRFAVFTFLLLWIATILLSASTFTLLAGDFAWGPRLITEACAPFAILTGLVLDGVKRSRYMIVSVLFVWGVFINAIGTLFETWEFYFFAGGLLNNYYYSLNPLYPIWQYPHCVWLFTLIKAVTTPEMGSWIVGSIHADFFFLAVSTVFMIPMLLGLQALWRKEDESITC